MATRSADRPSKVFKDPRELSLEIVYNVMEKGAYTNIMLDQYLKKFPLLSDDRHLVTEIVNGTIRMLKHLDWVLNLFLQKPLEKLNPWLRNSLRISLYQMLFMDKIPDYACVNSGVELSRKKAGSKLSGVVNGVLRNIIRGRDSIKYPEPVDSKEYLAVYYSQPEWLVEKCLEEYGIDATRDMLLYFNRRPALMLRNNELLGSRAELIDTLRQEEIHFQASDKTPWGMHVETMGKSLEEIVAFQAGRFYVQNEASMLAVSILKPQAGENIIDLCCGVGGKTTFMAEQMNNVGKIDAYDIYEHKLALLLNNCTRLGITIVEGHKQDILGFDEGLKQAEGVLLDAPCSGLGVLNRRADSRWRKNLDSISELSLLQCNLLQKAASMVLPGGRLIYSTCTINQEENDDVVKQFISNNTDFILEGFVQDISFFPLDSKDKEMAAGGMLTLLPGKYETDGMFYAKMRRKTSL
jgi:16S rRNA (cytosine967-C5)-methyltransferase